ncbi:hypothetical protein [uncultured Sulfitobacter sp.]|uniref:hypothetical protein n=1 Tax=uncultured Sulfitobacter sp. TaxID=191468 RepID=UPI0030DDA4EC|tara:strand:+ start:1294 stop:1491 length:198 start_codon:yes stop_codon:yes gene_type:complete
MLMVGMHGPVSAYANSFVIGGKVCGSVQFTCDRGDNVTVYTTPEAARAIADAFNAAIKPKQEDAA